MNTNKATATYLRSIMLPENGPASIPDDITERHILKQETSSYNLEVSDSGSGLLVCFPGAPGSRIGAHYRWNQNQTALEFDQWLETSQDLKKAFNYGRLISRKYDIQSSTLPAGLYALNGTLNAATFEGSLSEVENFSYNSLMSLTTNPQDKVNNQLVTKGVTVLNLPIGFDKPYVRLEDETPQGPQSMNGAKMRCTAAVAPRRYEIDLPTERLPPVLAIGTLQTIYEGNADIVNSTTVTGDINFQLAANPANDTKFDFQLDFLGMDNNDPVVSVTSSVLATADNYRGVSVKFTQSIPTESVTKPITRVRLSYKINQQTSIDNAATLGAMGPASVSFSSGNGNVPGVLRPVTLVAYEKMTPQSILTVAGVSNYELIPNPELLKNMVTRYGKYDPEGLNYAKMILSHREELDIRTVWRTEEYKERTRAFNEITDFSSDLPTSKAWGWRDIVRGIRKVAAPVLSTIFPMAAPLIGAADQFIGDLTKTNAAGGRYHSHAAGGRHRDVMDSWTSGAQTGKFSLKLKNRLESNNYEEIELPPPTKGVIIPVVHTVESAPGEAFGSLLIVIPGEYPELLDPNQQVLSHFENDTGGVWGIGEDIPFEGDDTVYTALPLKEIKKNGNIVVEKILAGPAMGPSCQLGLSLLVNDIEEGVPRMVFTGEISGDEETIIPICGVDIKAIAAHEHGLPLVGCQPGVDEVVANTSLASHLIQTGALPVQKTQGASRRIRYLGELMRTTASGMDEELQGLLQATMARAKEVKDVEIFKLLKLMSWTRKNDLTDNLFEWSREDPDAIKFGRLISTPPKHQEKPKGPDQHTAQEAKAVRISLDAVRAGADFASPEWVADNGYRGPNPGQFKYYMITGEVPNPGDDYEDYVRKPITRPTNMDKIRRLANSIYGLPHQEPAPEQFYDAVVEVFATNSGRGPDQDQMQDLRDLARQMKRRPRTAETRRQNQAPPRAAPSGGSRFTPSGNDGEV
ncbi:polyprotein [Victorian trout aquabirnavirus]|uniref:polyprotein n=1 Tax=Victorian trout aquabirnavirus TaxID=1661392 RepID=UPI0006D30F93|nr:polyprotein [Victorian trout aquabirnavirus]ALF95289.1 polyprotein [Victorian trout aquabirnavirus]